MKFILSLLLISIAYGSSFGQERQKCDIEFDTSVIKDENTSLYSIELELSDGDGIFMAQLFSMDKNEIVSSYKFDSNSAKRQIAFKEVLKGSYLIGISQGECHQTIGGIKGFKLE